MDSSESARDRQESEVSVLRAIYGDVQLRDLREGDAWRVWRPPELTLRLLPNHDSRGHREEHCAAVLRVRMGAEYPAQPPEEISVVESKGLSDALVQVLESELRAKAASLVGEVMVMELAELAAEWLSQHNKRAFSSFHEEMEATQREQRQQMEERAAGERRRSLLVRQSEEEAVRREVAESLERIEEEKQRRRAEDRRRIMLAGEHGDEATARTADGVARSKSASLSEGSEQGSAATRGRTKCSMERVELAWKGKKWKVDKLECLSSGGAKAVFSGMVLQPERKMVALSEWTLRVKGGGRKNRKSGGVESTKLHDADVLNRQLASLEQELASLERAPAHPNVVQYLAMDSDHKQQGRVRLTLVEEFVQGANLSLFLSENLPVEPALLQYLSVGILEALAHMHGLNFVHRDLRDTVVFLDNARRVRVAGFSVEKRARDLAEDDSSGDEEEKFPVAVGRGAKKADVHRFGLLLLSLIAGEIVSEAVVPRGLDSAMADFAKKCLCRDERDRWSAAQLLEHRWLKTHVERPLAAPNANGERADSPGEDDAQDAVPFVQVGSGMSRLQSEFAFICKIGKGGFGEVMKVKNLLDGQVYAIKEIKLSQANKQSTKKLMREVKLLSRLNHENVVRYYTSWIEVTTISEGEARGTETSFEEDATESSLKRSPPKGRNNSASPLKKKPPSILDQLNNMRCGGDPLLQLEEMDKSDVSISFASKFPDELAETSEDDDDDDSDEDDVFGTSFLPHSSSFDDDHDGEDDSDIVFENSRSEAASRGSERGDEESKPLAAQDGNARTMEIRVMYIQMEFCDKQTLRSAIDDGLHKDMQRVWRMFREIIEGLVHIHTQGMIHRDLKPVNIFLDSGDHVKIGDFGLATTNIMGNATENAVAIMDSSIDRDMTGQIGTALYIAPELVTGRTTTYSQKVDLFSLGVIFFEMCYPALKTGMERIKILTNLRSTEPRFPEDFDEGVLVQQSHIIRWLLNHDPSKRPNIQELLSSDYLPPPQVEEAELRELIRHTLSNSQSSAYRHVVDACLAQTMSVPQDITYDYENLRDLIKPTAKKLPQRTLLVQELIRRTAEDVFRRHGAIAVQQGHLLPRGKSRLYDRSGMVEVMTRGGKVASLPYDLRVGFARFLTRSRIQHLKRYCIAPVFREYQIFGCHPREQFECAFDVVSPSSPDLLADAEVLSVVEELLRRLRAFDGVNYFFRLNHALLLRGVLLNCGVKEEFHPGVYALMRETAGLAKAQRTTQLTNLGLAEQTAANLLGVLEHEGAPSKISGVLRYMTRKNNDASAMIKTGLAELEEIVAKSRAFGVRCAMVVSPSLVYNPGQFSGLMCQLVRKKKRGSHDVMAAGGRYDSLIGRFQHLTAAPSLIPSAAAEGAGAERMQSAVGISVAMDKLVAVVAAEFLGNFDGAQVLLIVEPGSKSGQLEAAEVASKLWRAGVKCLLCDSGQSVDQLQDMAKEQSSKFIVFIRESEGAPSVRVRCLEKDRFQEKKMPASEVADFLIPQCLDAHDGTGASAPSFSTSGASSGDPPSSAGGLQHQQSTSCGSSLPQVSYNHRLLDKSRYSSASRKRVEATASGKITPLLSLLSAGAVVEVLTTQLPDAVLRSAAALLRLDGDEAAFVRSMRDLLERHSRHRKELALLCDEVQELKFERGRAVVVLYSAEDHAFSTVMAPS